MQTTKRILYKEPKRSKRTNQPGTDSKISPFLKTGEYKKIPVSELDSSPLNYRKSFPKKELDELAADIGQHGIISNLVVRNTDSGRYELVAGERRFRAAKIAGLQEVPVYIVSLSDQEVIEIQLSENLQRSDTHPMEEAFAIEHLQSVYQNIEEIAVRMGKSRAFVYKRLKLVSLIDSIRELFLANKCSTQQAYEISALSSESQHDFYEEYCLSWQEDDDFEMPDTTRALNQFRYDLLEAPFDINDKNLVPEIGACISCPFNSATLKTLFPEQSNKAVCSKKECFKNKCNVSYAAKIQRIFKEDKPEALLFNGNPNLFEELIRRIPIATDLPQYNYYRVDTLNKPDPPAREDYINEIEDSEDDQEEFKEVLAEYENDLNEYERALESGNYQKGLLMTETKFSVVLFNPVERPSGSARIESPKAADLQSAIKSGTATIKLLQGEIDRIHSREERSIELDREKVQIEVQERFMKQLNSIAGKPTVADYVAVRLILFQSLDYSTRNTVLQTFFMENEKFDHRDSGQLYSQLENLSEDQFAYLIRMAVASKSDSKNPKSETGYFLYKMAGEAGLELEEIENVQKEKTNKRQAIQLEKISRLKKHMEEIKS
jgi:ParB family transcriptional regulator, chromosome partitioning protein